MKTRKPGFCNCGQPVREGKRFVNYFRIDLQEQKKYFYEHNECKECHNKARKRRAEKGKRVDRLIAY